MIISSQSQEATNLCYYSGLGPLFHNPNLARVNNPFLSHNVPQEPHLIQKKNSNINISDNQSVTN